MLKFTKNILVSGGIGNLATDIESFLVKKYPDYNTVKLPEGEVCNVEAVRQVIRDHNVDIIIHLVHSLPFNGSLSECLEYTRQAVYDTHILLQEAHNAGVRLFLMASSVLENHACQQADGRVPCRVHTANQAGAEHMAFSFWWSHQLPVVVARQVLKVPCPESSTPCIPMNSSRVGNHCNQDAGVAAAYDVLLHQGVPGQAYSIDADFNISPAEPIPQALPLQMQESQKKEDDEKINPPPVFTVSMVNGTPITDADKEAS